MADDPNPQDTPDPNPAPAAPAAPATPPAAAAAPPADPAAPPATPAAPASDPAKPEAKGDWPEDWRAKMAAGDDKLLKQLERYQSPADVYKKARELEKRLSSGELKKGLDKDATPEQLAEWRKENGIPETADGYALPKEMQGQIAEADQPKLKAFFEAAHKLNLTPDAANAVIAHYAQVEQEAAAQRKADDDAALNACKEDLIAEWGLADYRKNTAMVKGTFLGMLPEEERTLLENARLADGTPLFSHPGVLKGLTGFVREINPAATVVPNSVDPVKDIDGKIADYKKMMADTRSEYYSGPKADWHQAQYRSLLEAKEKLAKRVA
jgi:hypothetical protein